MVLLDRDLHRIHRFGSWCVTPSTIDCVCVLEIPVPCKCALQEIGNRLELRDMKKNTFKKFRSSLDDKKLEEYNSYRPGYRYVITYYRKPLAIMSHCSTSFYLIFGLAFSFHHLLRVVPLLDPFFHPFSPHPFSRLATCQCGKIVSVYCLCVHCWFRKNRVFHFQIKVCKQSP